MGAVGEVRQEYPNCFQRNEGVFVIENDGFLYSIDINTGKKNQFTKYAKWGNSNLATCFNNKIYYFEIIVSYQGRKEKDSFPPIHMSGIENRMAYKANVLDYIKSIWIMCLDYFNNFIDAFPINH